MYHLSTFGEVPEVGVDYQRVRTNFTLEELKLLPRPDRHSQDHPQGELVLSYFLTNEQAENLMNILRKVSKETGQSLPFGTGCPLVLSRSIIYLLTKWSPLED